MTDRHRRLDRSSTPGSTNSLWKWTDAKPVWIVIRNYIFIMFARLVPSLRARNWALRQLGAHIGSGVSWGLEATPDVFWPELMIMLSSDMMLYCFVMNFFKMNIERVRSLLVSGQWLGQR